MEPGEVRSYRKLVRDRIPQIIAAEGSTPHVRVLPEEEFAASLRTKLVEELQEYLAAAQAADTTTGTNHADTSPDAAIEELADLLELIDTLAALHGCSPEEVRAVQKRKRTARGGFTDRLFLEQVTRPASDGGGRNAH